MKFPIIGISETWVMIEICGTCCSGTAVGYDNISMNLIKESIDIIISPLTSA